MSADIPFLFSGMHRRYLAVFCWLPKNVFLKLFHYIFSLKLLRHQEQEGHLAMLSGNSRFQPINENINFHASASAYLGYLFSKRKF